MHLLSQSCGRTALALLLVGERVNTLKLPPLVLDDEEGLAGVLYS